MVRTLLVLVALATLPSTLAHAQERVYRWTDAQGVVHYSQTEPDRVKAEAKDVRSPRLPAPPADAADQAPVKSKAELACATARSNRTLLDRNAPLMLDRDGDGKLEPMTDAERADARELNARQIAAFCKDADASPSPTP